MFFRAIAAPLVALALLAATGESNARSQAITATVTCQRAPLYIFLPGQNLPQRDSNEYATLGQQLRVAAKPRATLESFEYYQTDIPVNEPGFVRGTHYWIRSDCVQLSK